MDLLKVALLVRTILFTLCLLKEVPNFAPVWRKTKKNQYQVYTAFEQCLRGC